MSVTTVGGGVPAPGRAPTGPAPTTPRGRTVPGVLGIHPGVIAAVGGVLLYNAVSGSPSQAAGGFGEPVATTGDGRRIYRKGGLLYVDGPGPGAKGSPITVRGGGGQRITMYRFESGSRPEDIPAPGEGRQPAPPVPRAKPGAAGGAGSGNGSTASRRTMADIQLDIARARTTPGTADDEKLVRELVGRLRAQAAVFERRKTLTKSQRATLERLYGEIASAENELEGYEQEREDALERQRDRAQQRRKDRAQRAAARERTRLAEMERITKRQRESAAKSAGLARWGWGASATLAKAGRAAKGKNEVSELERAQRALADAELRNAEFRRITREFGSNVMTGSQPGTAPATVIVNQNFKAPTTDRHREARMAWNAARTQFYG